VELLKLPFLLDDLVLDVLFLPLELLLLLLQIFYLILEQSDLSDSFKGLPSLLLQGLFILLRRMLVLGEFAFGSLDFLLDLVHFPFEEIDLLLDFLLLRHHLLRLLLVVRYFICHFVSVCLYLLEYLGCIGN